LGAGVGGIWIFSTGAGLMAGDAYTRSAPTPAPHPLFEIYLLTFIILFP